MPETNGFWIEYTKINDDDELFLWYGWPKKGVFPYFQLRPLSEILTMVNLQHVCTGFEPVQNLSSGFVEWSCAVGITTTPRCQIYKNKCNKISFLCSFSVFASMLERALSRWLISLLINKLKGICFELYYFWFGRPTSILNYELKFSYMSEWVKGIYCKNCIIYFMTILCWCLIQIHMIISQFFYCNFKLVHCSQIQQGLEFDVFKSSSNFYHLIVSIRAVLKIRDFYLVGQWAVCLTGILRP